MAISLTARLNVQTYAQTAVLTISYGFTITQTTESTGLHILVCRDDMTTQGEANRTMYQNMLIMLGSSSNTPIGQYAGSVTVPIYPLPPNTPITIELYDFDSGRYVTSISFTTHAIDTQAIYIEQKVKSSDPNWLPTAMSENSKQHNVDILYDALKEDDWTDEAIAVMAGMCEFYSDLNPAFNINYLLPFVQMSYGQSVNPTRSYFSTQGSYASALGIPYIYGQFGAYGGYCPYSYLPQYSDFEVGKIIPLNADIEITVPNMQLDLYTLDPLEDYPFAGFNRMRGVAVNPYLNAQYMYFYEFDFIPKIQLGSSASIYARNSACMAFMPVYRQHYVDVLDKFSETSWYKTDKAFSFEQYIEYFKYLKHITDDYLLLFGSTSEFTDFEEFTKSTELPYELAGKFIRSLYKTKFIETGDYRTEYGYVVPKDAAYPRMGYREYGSGITIHNWDIPDYAMKWYRYIKSKTKKRKMPIWEYLRYTI